ncbi:hypothetical protein EDC01DRAFT_658226 [Geopyxis carbonaria]|nr:hypothetical protein EDC01DRAFT_658226 [Geopyxis carbonaria]
MATSWKDKNVVISAARNTYALTGASTLSATPLGYAPELARTALSTARAGVLFAADPVIGRATKKLADLVAGHELPEVYFYGADAPLTPPLSPDKSSSGTNLAQSTDSEDAGAIDKTRIPLRMFNLDTGALETTWYAPDIQYCILSHSWKGCEVDYAFVAKLQKLDAKRRKCEELCAALPEDAAMARAVAGFELEKYGHLRGVPASDDVQKITRQCEEELRAFRRQLGKELELGEDEVTAWLEKLAERGSESPREAELGKRVEMLLQQRKSAEKIEKTVRWAQKFYGPGDGTTRRYVWIDTCCINKGMVGEYQESIALMGEWYANADFCLVHLDTKPVFQRWGSGGCVPAEEPDWIGWWKMFMGDSASSPEPNFADFHGIEKPYWATRAWTLQELALSKVAHFLNDHWEYLGEKGSTSLDAAAEMDRAAFTEATTPNANSRAKIAEFSRVPVEEVCRGARKSRLPAFDLIRFASERNSTVETDKAYSMMGMLDVKFPGFSAEGLQKALSRLLDEVITTSNDVSVFNWDGKDLGSDIVGRSLYPKNFMAYNPTLRVPQAEKIDKDLQKATKAPTALVRSEDMRVFKMYKELEAVLDKIQEYVMDKDVTPDTVALLQGAIKRILDNQVEKVELDKMAVDHTRNIAKAFRAVREGHAEMFTQFKKGTEEPGSPEAPEDSEPKTPLLSSFGSFGSPSLSSAKGMFGRKSSTKKVEKVPERPPIAKQKLSDRAIGSLGKFFKPTEVDEKIFPRYLERVVKNVLSYSPAGNKEDVKEDEEKEESEVDPKILEELIELFRGKMNMQKDIDKDLENYKKDQEEEEQSDQDAERPPTKAETISPNPIIVTSSGLEGVFDVQRVITTIQDEPEMRKQIQAKYAAGNPGARIAGTCDISTGCAVVTVEFSCPANMLEKQLDVGDVVRKIALRPTRRARAASARKQAKTKVPSPPTSPSDPLPDETKAELTEKLESVIETAESESLEKDPEAAEVPEAAAATAPVSVPEDSSAWRIERMLAHVQESDINLVAGEWVLARFSGVPSAQWFLCLLELGSTHDFYGWRIPSSSINFNEARAEDELRVLWRQYMEGKKVGLCNLLKLALDKKRSLDDEDRKLEAAGRAEDGFQLAAGGLEYLGAKARTAWLKFEEKHRTHKLRDEALERANIPKSLYAAVLTLERSATLPAMYFASRQVHMF